MPRPPIAIDGIFSSCNPSSLFLTVSLAKAERFSSESKFANY